LYPVAQDATRRLKNKSGIDFRRVGRYLEHQGLLERHVENSYLTTDAFAEDPMKQLLDHSITCRIAVGAQSAANAQRGPRSALAIGYGTTHVIFEPLDFIARLERKAESK
jgi:hypothetical protein